jgi:hypothetical protein
MTPEQAKERGIKVKPLVWIDSRGDGTLHASSTIGICYVASSVSWGWRNYPDAHPVDGDIEAAKAAAQADYESRILEALE